MIYDPVTLARAITAVPAEQLEWFGLITYRALFQNLSEVSAREVISSALAAVRGEYDDFDVYISEMLDAGLLPDWSRATPHRYFESLYLACKGNAETRLRMMNGFIQTGTADPYWHLKFYVRVRLSVACPEIKWDDTEVIVEQAFSGAETRWPAFKSRAADLWAVWHGLIPNFAAINPEQYLESVWLVVTSSSFMQNQPSDVSPQPGEQWPAEVSGRIQ